MKTFEQMTFDEKIALIQITVKQGVRHMGNEQYIMNTLLPWLLDECQRLRAAVLKQGVNE